MAENEAEGLTEADLRAAFEKIESTDSKPYPYIVSPAFYEFGRAQGFITKDSKIDLKKFGECIDRLWTGICVEPRD